MLTIEEKIAYLQETLFKKEGNYFDFFKDDIIIFINEFNINNERLKFLNNLISFNEINNWIENLLSRIVLKFDEQSEQINDFIYDYIENG